MSQEMCVENYEGLVSYLGVVLGSQYEILLQDMKNRVLLAVANGYITLRVKGGPITSFAERIFDEQIWKKVDYLTNLKCKTASDHLILTSIYFIKSNTELLGLLCINYDTTQYSADTPYTGDIHNILGMFQPKTEEGSSALGAEPYALEQESAGGLSSISENVESIVDQVVQEYCAQNNATVSHLKYAEKQRVIQRLYQKDVFRVKGAIGYVAQMLNNSETTIYRYLRGMKEKT